MPERRNYSDALFNRTECLRKPRNSALIFVRAAARNTQRDFRLRMLPTYDGVGNPANVSTAGICKGNEARS